MPIIGLHGGARVRSHAAWFAICACLANGCSSSDAEPAARGYGAGLAADAGADPPVEPEVSEPPGSPPTAPFTPDWSGAVAATTTTSDGQVALSMHAVIQEGWLFVVVDQIQRRPELWYNLFIDTDNDPRSGHKTGLWRTSSGVDRAVSGGALQTYTSVTGDGFDWGTWTQPASVSVTLVESTLGGIARYFQIPLETLRATSQAGLGLGFQSVYEGENAAEMRGPDFDQVPASTPTILRIAPEGSEPYDVANCRYGAAPPRPEAWNVPTCPANYPTATPEPKAGAFGVGRGVIIPAYIDPTDKDKEQHWSAILGGIEQVRASQNEGVSDYWVAINGPDPGGPPAEFAQWSPYLAEWNRLTKQKDIKVFGYVYSCVGKCKTDGKLRPLQAVMDDITRWVCGYPDLDGIWIDEFYPQYELTTSVSGSILPNVTEAGALTPFDRCFIQQADGKNNDSYHVNPDGGYFAQLTQWIRDTYPNLKIIGNAGGKLISTLPNYAQLVDVIVGYENSYHRAFDLDGTAPEKKLIASPLGRFGQLAIFHETSVEEFPIAIDAAWMLGYTHVYATDGLYANGAGNPWGSVASYLVADELPMIFPLAQE